MEHNQAVAVITGGAQGIGRRTAQVLAARGYSVAIIDLQSAQEVVESIKAAGGSAWAFAGNITNELTLARFIEEVLQQYGRIDVLVNNAGISHIAPAEHTKLADFERVLKVNLVAPFVLAQLVGSKMLESGRGSIINVASVAGLLGISDRAAYNASKHGLIGLTRTLAAEWGGRGIRVNAVCPGWVKTEMDIVDQAGGSYSDSDITGRIPMARFASPDDIANAIAFLADSNQSGFISGQTLAVDGGWTADGSWETLRLRKR